MNLQEMIQHHKGDRSYPQLAAAAGGTVSSRTLQSISKDGFTRFPDAATLTSIAAALGLQPRDVVLAAAKSLGIDVDDLSTAEVIRPGTPGPEEQIYYWRKHAEHYKARALGVTTGLTGHQGGHAHARR
jgi:hypothetical protein